MFTFSCKFLQRPLIVKELNKHENEFNRKAFHVEKILKIDFQNFHVSWKVSKSKSCAFLGSLHDETIVKYVFHEMLWKKYFTVYILALMKGILFSQGFVSKQAYHTLSNHVHLTNLF